VIDALDEEANNDLVDGPGAEKSIVKGALTALGTLVVGAVVSGESAFIWNDVSGYADLCE